MHKNHAIYRRMLLACLVFHEEIYTWLVLLLPTWVTNVIIPAQWMFARAINLITIVLSFVPGVCPVNRLVMQHICLIVKVYHDFSMSYVFTQSHHPKLSLVQSHSLGEDVQ